MNEIKKKKLSEFVKKLSEIRGKHTELVSVYVPAGYSLAKVANQIRLEQSTAQNIKSKSVRKNVTSALEKITQHLKLYKNTPKNGLVVFCGNIAEKEGQTDIELFALEPPEPIKTKVYFCGQTFVLDPLKDLLKEKEVYGVIVLDKSEASIGLIKGKKVEVLKNLTSIVPGKTKKGGQSSVRFARVREGLLFDFLKQVGEIATHHFNRISDLRGIIIGGPGPIKERMVNEDFLPTNLKKKILGVVDTSYSGEYGLKETIQRAEEIISEASIIKEKKLLDRFFDELAKDSGLAVYGIKEVIEALKAGAIETLLVSEQFDFAKAKLSCECGFKEEKILKKGQKLKCPKCGKDLEIKEEDLLEELEKMAEQVGTEVELISSDTQKGAQLKELGGIGGILRFRLEQ
jgi:peptide chain release factor subunit 1